METLRWLLEAEIVVAGSALLLREVIGNAFGLACALGGMFRKVWAWPVGIAGNLILLTVFLGSFIGLEDSPSLLGQAGRQIMFLAVSVYGWVRWSRSRRQRETHGASGAITPEWAGWRVRISLILALTLGTAALTPLFRILGSWEPVWADAWTFVGSLLATYGMAKGWVEFWLIWVAVDIVGVPLLWSAGYYASAFMYLFYGVFTLIGFFVWWRASRGARPKPSVETVHLDPRIHPAKRLREGR
ncbi:nicotinamide riboside transporter PnuC [Nesterenkonia alkaliphila]|uniref:Nicotinamide riboside transporter PnuC n=1 Tax=Nesterenkonia alkaliphila TaxID=1463631 RepID=A0A7K1UGI6_9MICC|nr:nicotinamide riboside transporter PnuC [Nesterenkonia alkaliphila]MVT25514.1 nicotinamide riboside transporter PnuC [Nesterenkonia alkaliphila]GFZ91192.1 membrane protein [Nesterenkonia alkaliphila]